MIAVLDEFDARGKSARVVKEESTMPNITFSPVINVPAPVVNVAAPDVVIPELLAPVINLPEMAPVVNVAAPIITVPEPVVNVAGPVVNVPEQPAPVVNVDARPRRIKRERQTVQRDAAGNITGTVTEVEYE
jgi:hypothetical protein